MKKIYLIDFENVQPSEEELIQTLDELHIETN